MLKYTLPSADARLALSRSYIGSDAQCNQADHVYQCYFGNTADYNNDMADSVLPKIVNALVGLHDVDNYTKVYDVLSEYYLDDLTAGFLLGKCNLSHDEYEWVRGLHSLRHSVFVQCHLMNMALYKQPTFFDESSKDTFELALTIQDVINLLRPEGCKATLDPEVITKGVIMFAQNKAGFKLNKYTAEWFNECMSDAFWSAEEYQNVLSVRHVAYTYKVCHSSEATYCDVVSQPQFQDALKAVVGEILEAEMNTSIDYMSQITYNHFADDSSELLSEDYLFVTLVPEQEALGHKTVRFAIDVVRLE